MFTALRPNFQWFLRGCEVDSKTATDKLRDCKVLHSGNS